MADALQHPWFAKLHTEADLAPPPPCPFNFELCELNLDHYLLAGLDAVRAFHPEYPLKISEMLRFGIMHDRGADEVHRTRGATGSPAWWHASENFFLAIELASGPTRIKPTL